MKAGSIEEFNEIKRRKQEGGLLWFIERKDTNEWFYHTFEQKEGLPCTCSQCYPHGYPFKTSKDGWTKDPVIAEGYLTKEEAERCAFWIFITDEKEENLIITEHLFAS